MKKRDNCWQIQLGKIGMLGQLREELLIMWEVYKDDQSRCK
jgi:hypothetical protein